MKIIDFTEENIIVQIPKNNQYNKNLLKNNWPIYEYWTDNKFIGFLEFIPNRSIGVNSSTENSTWQQVFDYIITYDIENNMNIIFEKNGDNFLGKNIKDLNKIEELRYIET